MLNSESVAGESVEEYVNELTADRLRRRTYECQLTSVSDIIRENQIDKIDLLKIDAEKSELDIINGIEDRDWPKINQIVLEIHDPHTRGDQADRTPADREGVPMCRGAGNTARACRFVQSLCNPGRGR